MKGTVNGSGKVPRSGLRGKWIFGAVGVLAAVLGWALLASSVGSALILPSPREALASLVSLAGSPGFWRAIAGTLVRVAAAFGVSMIAGSATGMLAALFPPFSQVMAPILTTIRATPVMALILVAMFWFPAGNVPVFSGVLMAYPVVHTSLCAGISSIDRDLVEMSAVFKVPRMVRFSKLLLPGARPHILSGAKNALGLCWKVVVAGEVLSQPLSALGSGMQDARLSLDTPGVFAWAAVTVAMCGLSEFLFGIAEKAGRAQSRDQAA